MKNQFVYRSRISEEQFTLLLRYFCKDYNAKELSSLCNLSRNGVNRYLLGFRERIAQLAEEERSTPNPLFKGPRLSTSSEPHSKIFGVGIGDEKIHTRILENCSKEKFKKLVLGEMVIEEVCNPQEWSQFKVFIDLSSHKFFALNNNLNQYIKGNTYQNSLVSAFYDFAKRRLSYFKGIPNSYFYLHLKETEYRFNHRHDSLYQILSEEFNRMVLRLPKLARSSGSFDRGYH